MRGTGAGEADAGSDGGDVGAADASADEEDDAPRAPVAADVDDVIVVEDSEEEGGDATADAVATADLFAGVEGMDEGED